MNKRIKVFRYINKSFLWVQDEVLCLLYADFLDLTRYSSKVDTEQLVSPLKELRPEGGG